MDGTFSDLRLWVEQWFFMPGDALVALLGPPASPGGIASGLISAAAWLLGLCALFYARGFFQDVVDPTYRTQQRERREARARARRVHQKWDSVRRRRPAGQWWMAGLIAVSVAVVVLAVLEDVL